MSRLCLWQPCLGHILSQIKLHNEYFMGSWTDPRESPLFWDHRLLQSPHQWAFSFPLSSSDRINYIKPYCRATDGQRRAHKKMHYPFLKRAAVNTTDFNALVSPAAVALWMFLLIASLHIPPTTFPPSLSLSLLPSLACVHRAALCWAQGIQM